MHQIALTHPCFLQYLLCISLLIQYYPFAMLTYFYSEIVSQSTKILMSNFEAIISLWQAITGCVATAERLTYRHLDNDTSCPNVLAQWSD